MRRAILLATMLAMGAPPASSAAGVELRQSTLGNIFVQGESVDFPVSAGGDSISWRVTDFFGAEIAQGSERLIGGAADLRPRVADPGYFTLDIKAIREGQEVESARTVFAVVPRPKPGRDASPFGVMTHFAKGWPTDVIPLIRKAGIVHVRDEQPWRQVEKQPGDYQFPPRLSGYMADFAEQGIDPLIVLAFANPLYDHGETPYSDEGRAAYAAYAGAVARNYQPGLRAVEIWNEYNGSFCDGPCRFDRAGAYAAMLRDAYRRVKAEAPSVTVLGGAGVPIPLDYYRSLFEKGALASMDAIVIHPYRKQPEGVGQEIEALRRLMARYGAPKPIWATEFSDLSDMRKSRDDVARYLVRMSVRLLAAKVNRMYWYLLRDYQEFNGLGLLRDEDDPLGRYTPAPAFAAYATLIHELDGATFTGREPSAPGVSIYDFDDGSGGAIKVAWSLTPGAVYDVAGGDSVHVTDMMGGEKVAPSHDGTVSIVLDANPVYVVGASRIKADHAGPRVAAYALADFSLVQGAKGWSYGVIARPDGALPVGAAFPIDFQPLLPDPSGDGWIAPESPALKIKAAVMHPGRIKGEAAWAVRRWSADTAGAVRVTGSADLADTRSAGVVLAIAVDGHVVYAAELGGGRSSKAEFDIPLTVAKGAKIDFAVGPGQAGGVDFDATHVSATITAG
jgi:hypothetical protein